MDDVTTWPAARLGRDPTEDFDMVDTATRTPALPKPDPRLREFERFIGTWEMKGRTLESDPRPRAGRTISGGDVDIPEFIPGER